MDSALRKLCESFLAGHLPGRSFLSRCLQLTTESTMAAQLDVDRRARCGFPEVIFAPGKSNAALLELVATQIRLQQGVLVTRLSAEQRAALCQAYPNAVSPTGAGTFRLPDPTTIDRPAAGKVAVITAGTGDLPVALEAQETLHWMRVGVEMLQDVGVAGPHRFPAHVERLQSVDAAVVVAGMEGALPSVVGGYLACPVFAVPTSVGYGASLGGIAALLSMLNSCAANVSVVNIDAGFKAAYCAGLVAHRSNQACDRSEDRR
jgi:NCAIR mutase (PurE)-related protein